MKYVAIGSHEPDVREVDDALVRRATVVVESRDSALREAGERVDLVVLTGDMLGEPRALHPVLEALGRFRPRLGAVALVVQRPASA